MGFTQYLIHGVAVGDNQFNRFNSIYQQDQAQAFAATHEYKGSITESKTQGTVLKRILDDAIEILTVSDDVRVPNLEFWEKRRVQTLVLGIGAMVLAPVAIIATCLAVQLLIGNLAVAAAVAAGALGVASIALAILGFYRHNQAQEQLNAWKDPIVTYQVQRQKTSSEGFTHVFSSQSKNRLIHPEECRQLWINWSDQEIPSYQSINLDEKRSPQQISRIKQFFAHNPLDVSVMNYAFQGVAPAPQNIQDLSSYFNQLKASYSNVRSEAEKARNDIRREESDLIKKNESKREAWLAPAKFVRDNLIESAKKEKSNKTQPLEIEKQKAIAQINEGVLHGKIILIAKNERIAEVMRSYEENPLVVAANREYEAQCRKYVGLYQLAAAPINLKFDNNKKKIEKWAEHQIHKVNKRENKNISRFSTDVQGIAHAYVDMITYNPAQMNNTLQSDPHPKLDIFFHWNEAYIPPSVYKSEFTAADIGQFYHQIHQHAQPIPVFG